MRISSLAFLLTLAACGERAREQEQARAAEQQAQAALPKFACATGDGPLRPDCTAERTRTDNGWVLTLRHSDGHFRRLLVKDDNSITAADGAQPARVTPGPDGVEVAIATDRYRLPAQR